MKNNLSKQISDRLIEQGVWEREVAELIETYNPKCLEDIPEVIMIFDSPFDLGTHYVDNNVGTLDPHIEAVLDYDQLGRVIAENNDEFLLLSSNRVVEFDA